MTAQPAKKPVPLTTLTTGDVRLCFPRLDKPHPNGPGSDKLSYQATILIPPGSPDVKRLSEAMKHALLAKFTKMPPGLKPLPLRKCEEKGDMAGYEPGWVFLPSKSDTPVLLVGPDLGPLQPAAFYPGCWVRARLNAWCYSNQFGKGVSFDLQGLQFVRDGERLDGRARRAAPEEAFEALELAGDPAHSAAADQEWDPLA